MLSLPAPYHDTKSNYSRLFEPDFSNFEEVSQPKEFSSFSSLDSFPMTYKHVSKSLSISLIRIRIDRHRREGWIQNQRPTPRTCPFCLEHVYDYEPSGHHPVHLGDVYGNNQQYQIIYKLSHGGSATVWLCRDTNSDQGNRYVALKILIAEISENDCRELQLLHFESTDKQHGSVKGGSESICLPLDHFKIHGPNGSHLCFVYPVLGPNVSLGLFDASSDPGKDLRDISLQIVRAVQFLLIQGIFHGGKSISCS